MEGVFISRKSGNMTDRAFPLRKPVVFHFPAHGFTWFSHDAHSRNSFREPEQPKERAVCRKPRPQTHHSLSYMLSRFHRIRLFNPIFYSPPGSSAQGLLQARILKRVAMPFSRSSQPRDRTRSPTLQADSSLLEAPGKPSQLTVSTNFPAT